MATKRKETDIATRTMIISMCYRGKSLREIAAAVGRTHSTVQKIVNKWKNEGTLKNLAGRGRKRILTSADERIIVRTLRKNPKTSIPKLTSDVAGTIGRPLSADTVRRVAHRNNLRGRVARKKPFISKVNMKKRLEFAKAYVNKPKEFWNNVLFTDETKINLFGSDGRQMVWRKPRTELQVQNLVPTVKHGGGSQMLWGSMAASGTGTMEFIDTTMDKMGYMNILKRNLKPSVQKLDLPQDYYFQQDNDPKHTAYIVREWLLYNVPNQLRTPPQSPDLNPIEHLWWEVKHRLQTKNPRNKTDLKTAVKEIWESIPSTVTKNLVESMPRRLQAVLDAKGGHTKY